MIKRLLCAALSGAVIFSLVSCASNKSQNSSKSSIESDLTSGSPWIDSNILQNVLDNPNVSLKDHYDLACNGKWVSQNKIKEGEPRNVYLLNSKYTLDERITSFLKDKSYSTNHDAQLAQNFYNSFLDWKARDANSLKSFKPYLEKIEAIKSFDDLVKYYAQEQVSFAMPFGYGIETNPQDTNYYCMAIAKPACILMDTEDYKNLDNMSAYTKLVYDSTKELASKVLSYCGYSSEKIDSIYEGAIKYESLVAANSYTNAESHIQANVVKLLSQLVTEDKIKNYKWFALLKAGTEKIGLTDIKTYLLGEKMDYFENLDKILNDSNIEIIKDYMLVHSALGASSILNKDCFYATLENTNKLRGVSGFKKDSEYALDTTKEILAWPLSKLYVEKYVTAEDKQNIYNVIKTIIDEYKEMLMEEDFLSESTKKEAINKLSKLRVKCMYPDNWDAHDYSALDFSNDYFDNTIKIIKFEEKKQVEEFNKPIDKDVWQATPITLNAFYNPLENSINILPGLIGDVLYNKDMPFEQVYAMVGSVIGHEISHAFDPSGSTFDADGNSKNWWTPEDYAKFNAKIDKLVAYYDGIKIWDDFYCNGQLVKTEACADIAGVTAVLRIAKKRPNFNYDLFFRSFAKCWAANITPEFIYSTGKYDTHPSNYLRTNVTVAQFDEFCETYGVKEGDGMYIAPENRVKIW